MSYFNSKKPVKVSKKGRILSNICKKCGRYRKIPQAFCNDCWKEMDTEINHKSVRLNEVNHK